MRRLAVPTLLLLAACAAPAAAPRQAAQSRAEVEAAMQHYMRLLRTMNADSVSGMFTPGARLVDPGRVIHTRDSIRTFLAGFTNVQVDSASARTDTIEVLGDNAFLWGSFSEHYTVRGQPMAVSQGRFVAWWSRGRDGTWRIERFATLTDPRGS